MTENPKSYDQAFKALSDADPRGLMGIFGVLPLGIRAEVEPIPRDLSMRPLVIDSGYLVRRPGRKPYILLFEAITSWKAAIAERLTWYGAFLGHKYELPVYVHVVPLTQESCPRQTPTHGRAVRGEVTVRARLNWVKPWLLDARTVLDLKSPELDPWAILFEISEAQEDETLKRVSASEKGAPLFRMLGGLRYRRRKEEWKFLLERMARMIRPEIMRESLAVQEWLEEGRATGAHEMLLKFLAFKFPGWQVPASLDSISSAETLDRLFDKAAVTKNPAAMARAIDKAAKGLEF